jgi:hypothetical protein
MMDSFACGLPEYLQRLCQLSNEVWFPEKNQLNNCLRNANYEGCLAKCRKLTESRQPVSKWQTIATLKDGFSATG